PWVPPICFAEEICLTLYADPGERQHRAAGRWTSHRKRWTERGEDQHLLHLGQDFFRLLSIRKNSIVLNAPVRVYKGFDHERVRIDGIHRQAECGLLQFRGGVEHNERHVVVRLQRRWSNEVDHGNAEDDQSAEKASRRWN